MKHINLSLYLGEENGNLGWDLRVHIALDVARGLEYLHDGVSYHMICTEIILIYIFSNNCMYCCHSRQFLLSFIATSNLTIFSWISPCEPGYVLLIITFSKHDLVYHYQYFTIHASRISIQHKIINSIDTNL